MDEKNGGGEMTEVSKFPELLASSILSADGGHDTASMSIRQLGSITWRLQINISMNIYIPTSTFSMFNFDLTEL